MKTCTKCGNPQEDSEFFFKNEAKDIRHSACKTCKRAHDKNAYNTQPNRQAKIRKNALLSIERAKTIVRRVKKQNFCKKCGEGRWYVLDFHHIGDKDINISEMVARGSSLTRIKKEMKKCNILCSNCHREEHYLENKANLVEAQL